MAFENRYICYTSDRYNKYLTRIQQDINYTIAVEELTAAAGGLERRVEGNPEVIEKNIIPTSCRLTVRQDHFALSELHHAKDRQFKTLVDMVEILGNEEFDSSYIEADNWVNSDNGETSFWSQGSFGAQATGGPTANSRIYRASIIDTPAGVYSLDYKMDIVGYGGTTSRLTIEFVSGSTVIESFVINSPSGAQTLRVNIPSTVNFVRFYVDNFDANWDARMEYFRLSQPIFRGWVDPKQSAESYSSSYPAFVIHSVDGLGDLSDIPYPDSDQYQDVMSVFTDVFDEIGLDLNICEYNDIYADGFSSGGTFSAFKQEYVHTKRFWTVDNSTDPRDYTLARPTVSCEDALADMLITYGCRVVQSWGEWWIQKIDVVNIDETEQTEYRLLNAAGSVQDSFDIRLTILLGDDNIVLDSSSSETIQRTLSQVSINNDFKEEYQMLPGLNFDWLDWSNGTTLNDWSAAGSRVDLYGLFGGISVTRRTGGVCELKGYTPDHENLGASISDNGSGKVRISGTSLLTNPTGSITTSDYIRIDGGEVYGVWLAKVTAAIGGGTPAFDLNIDYIEDARDVAWKTAQGSTTLYAMEIGSIPLGNEDAIDDSLEWGVLASATSAKLNFLITAEAPSSSSSTFIQAFVIAHDSVSGDIKVMTNGGEWFDPIDDGTNDAMPSVGVAINSGSGPTTIEVAAPLNTDNNFFTTGDDVTFEVGIVGDGTAALGVNIINCKLSIKTDQNTDPLFEKLIDSDSKLIKTVDFPAPDYLEIMGLYSYLAPLRKLDTGDYVFSGLHSKDGGGSIYIHSIYANMIDSLYEDTAYQLEGRYIKENSSEYAKNWVLMPVQILKNYYNYGRDYLTCFISDFIGKDPSGARAGEIKAREIFPQGDYRNAMQITSIVNFSSNGIPSGAGPTGWTKVSDGYEATVATDSIITDILLKTFSGFDLPSRSNFVMRIKWSYQLTGASELTSIGWEIFANDGSNWRRSATTLVPDLDGSSGTYLSDIVYGPSSSDYPATRPASWQSMGPQFNAVATGATAMEIKILQIWILPYFKFGQYTSREINQALIAESS